MQEENVSEQKGENAGEGAPSLGKFKSVDALVRAYGELESEFTRRSQRLRQLEEENESLRSQTRGRSGSGGSARKRRRALPRGERKRGRARPRVGRLFAVAQRSAVDGGRRRGSRRALR